MKMRNIWTRECQPIPDWAKSHFRVHLHVVYCFRIAFKCSQLQVKTNKLKRLQSKSNQIDEYTENGIRKKKKTEEKIIRQYLIRWILKASSYDTISFVCVWVCNSFELNSSAMFTSRFSHFARFFNFVRFTR